MLAGTLDGYVVLATVVPAQISPDAALSAEQKLATWRLTVCLIVSDRANTTRNVFVEAWSYH